MENDASLDVGGESMAWKIQVDPEMGFIHTVYSGTLTERDVKESTVEALALAPGDGPRLFLTDVRDAESRLSTLDIYNVPKQWDALRADRRNKLALVVPGDKKIWSDAQFYETICNNRGWNVKVFAEQAPAIDWLTGS